MEHDQRGAAAVHVVADLETAGGDSLHRGTEVDGAQAADSPRRTRAAGRIATSGSAFLPAFDRDRLGAFHPEVAAAVVEQGLRVVLFVVEGLDLGR